VPTVKLHRCSWTAVHTDLLDQCWKVQKALDDQGVDYEVIKAPLFPRGRRKDVIRISGQHFLPVIEFEDGSAYRAESKEMAETIRAGKLFDQAAASA
jgi:glutathione S-transferase